MKNRERRPAHPLVAVGFGFLSVGSLAWLWTAEWRFAVTGLVLMIAFSMASGVERWRQP